jgi:molybdopterin molybdotransferase
LIAFNQALEQVLSKVRVLDFETVPILESLGRVLAEDIYADADVPAGDNSAVDGYALKAADTLGAGNVAAAELSIVSELPAGQVYRETIKRGQTVRIMTGAPVPAGADSIVRLEDTRRTDSEVKIFREAKPGQNIRVAGEAAKKEERLIAQGQVISPAQIGLMALVGRQQVKVVQRPEVAVLATGDELIEVNEIPTVGKVRNSNSYTFLSLARHYGGNAKDLGIARDTLQALKSKVREGLDSDILVTCGGVSVGDYDLVKPVMQDLGDMIFWRVAMKPGEPLAFGMVEDTLWFGLPGNPVAAMVCFEQFVQPAMLKMSGHVNLHRPELEAVIEEDLEKKTGIRFFVRVVIEKRKGKYFAKRSGPKGSGILKSMSGANGLLVLPEQSTGIKAGQTGQVQMLDWPETG